ncbi:hypothetical protein N7492_002498 [Penicillium capsulatum]|uniref:Short-chain dehydrogenase n=1 Tax=Penicillium capsulatum TaxID=69766 RepID=A0A9W9LV75_9EURO|nr:hypothetical protein N7492_002498 [Penicillium capsulatum]
MSRYAAVHANPNGLGDARPTAMQIIQDEGIKDQLANKVAVITGVSSGMGFETVHALASTGMHLFLTARDLTKAKNALGDKFNPDQMELIHMDNASLDSVHTATNAILAKTNKINILVNNAGVMGLQTLQLTDRGHELQFATNHLAHFLFFHLLAPALLAGSSSDFQSRVVVVASSAQRVHGLNASDNYHYQKGGYNPWDAYTQSKIANVYMANEIERRYGARGLHATSLHPGMVYTDLGRSLPAEELGAMVRNPEVQRVIKNPAQGAATSVWAAVAKELEGRVLDDHDQGWDGAKYVSHTYDPKEEARLWEDSLEMVGLSGSA